AYLSRARETAYRSTGSIRATPRLGLDDVACAPLPWRLHPHVVLTLHHMIHHLLLHAHVPIHHVLALLQLIGRELGIILTRP
ncbi:hypothetical protein, partial [Salmonella enterica]|uniref:hypothetical protein n=1 Tax=Salmonella enterica TaxID=28901 RepID=UPI003CF232FF